MFANCEQVLLKGTLGELASQISTIYVSCTQSLTLTLQIQLSILAKSYNSFRQVEGLDDTLHDVVDFLKKNKKIWSLITEAMSLVKIILVMPATNASSECTFSALWRVKSYLLTTMSNNLSPYNYVKQLSRSSYDMDSQ